MQVNRHNVTLYTLNKTFARTVAREWFSGRPVNLTIIDELEKMPAPGSLRADYILSTAGLSPAVERFALRLGAQVAVIPEAADWIINKTCQGGVAALAGHDLARHGY